MNYMDLLSATKFFVRQKLIRIPVVIVQSVAFVFR